MARIGRGCVAAVVIFGAERGAEAMWPTMTPWAWWGGAAILGALWLGAEAVLYRRRRKHGFGPEVRISDTTTYREQPDGSRLVTTTKFVKPVALSANFHLKLPPSQEDGDQHPEGAKEEPQHEPEKRDD